MEEALEGVLLAIHDNVDELLQVPLLDFM